MFDTLDAAAVYAKTNTNAADRHATLYTQFGNRVVHGQPRLKQVFEGAEGFGELPFAWNWYLVVKDAPSDFRFLEIGVYKGRTLALIQAAADLLGKTGTIVGVTPLSGDGDKYSGYETTDYFAAIRRSFSNSGLSFDNTRIIKGFSQEEPTLYEASQQGPYDILFIDGCHDYEVVCKDIENYLPMLKPGGILVMDDASLFLEAPYGLFKGHPDVAAAIRDRLDGRSDVEHLFAVGHNRVWRKKLE
jgi:hypothetical protein